jgi:aminoglycoside/choline kinase family phosphotransferase
MQQRADAADLPAYDEDLLRRELELFPDWYLQRQLGLSLPASTRRLLDYWFDRLIERALAQPQVFVHRDFMPRNLMLSDPAPGIIDFQDAVLGPVSYDPVCLFMDAFFSLPDAEVRAGLLDYHRRARDAGLPVPDDAGAFLSDCRWMGVQRHLKVIGIFARIAHRDGKPHYLEDVPRFFAYLERAADAEPELEELVRELRRWAPREAA